MISPFDSVHVALAWYFGRTWQKAPNYSRSNWPESERIQSSPWIPSVFDVSDAFLKIRSLLEIVLTARDRDILERYYHRKSPAEAEIRMRYEISESGINYIRRRAIERLEPEFIRAGIVRLPKYGEPIYAKDGGEGAADRDLR